ncbi:MAG: V-type ATP synthase subunit E [Oscillospiraceae bacterium]|nr:V-type ATP synthase subunit E [Oscillospiraceae bacterium]
MNGLERITSRIEADARREIDGVLDEGRAEAERVVGAWRARIDAEISASAERNEKAAAEREERLKSAAELEARKTVLAAKQELVDAAYGRALEKLCAVSGEEKTALLAGLLLRASSTGAEEALFSAADRADGAKAVARANAEGGKALTLSEESAPIRGGFILRDKNVEVNCAFETLLRLQRTETAGAVAKILFP